MFVPNANITKKKKQECFEFIRFKSHNFAIQPCNKQVSKEVVNDFKFDDIFLSCNKTVCSRVTGILILTGSLGCFKEVKTMDMILGKCKFPNSFLPYFQ